MCGVWEWAARIMADRAARQGEAAGTAPEPKLEPAPDPEPEPELAEPEPEPGLAEPEPEPEPEPVLVTAPPVAAGAIEGFLSSFPPLSP